VGLHVVADEEGGDTSTGEAGTRISPLPRVGPNVSSSAASHSSHGCVSRAGLTDWPCRRADAVDQGEGLSDVKIEHFPVTHSGQRTDRHLGCEGGPI
jgi:hypothetical protein